MDFYILAQNGQEVQDILNKVGTIEREFQDLERQVSELPITKVSSNSYNLDTISQSGIYFVPTNALNKETIKPPSLAIYSDTVCVIHLQGSVAGKLYKSQYLITQDNQMKMICYQRNMNSDGAFGEFVTPDHDLQIAIQNLQIKLEEISESAYWVDW